MLECGLFLLQALSGQVDQNGGGCIGCNGCNAVFHAVGALVHLALPNHLVVGGLEDEVVPLVLGDLAFEVVISGAVLAYRIDAVLAGGLGGVLLAGEDDLAVAGFQAKDELVIAGFVERAPGLGL